MPTSSFDNINILQSGIQKSGNLFLYNIIDNIFQVKNIEKKSTIRLFKDFSSGISFTEQERIYPFDVLVFDDGELPKFKIYRNSHIEIDNLELFAKSNSHVWTHSKLDENYTEELKAFQKVVCIIRDPRDRAISNSHWVFANTRNKDLGKPDLAKDQNDFLKKHFIKDLIEWGHHLINHAKLSTTLPIYFIFYENLVFDFQNELKRLSDYLDIELSKKEMKIIAEKVNFSSMSKKDPEHVRKGGFYGWKNEIGLFQRIITKFTVGKLLIALNYPIKTSDTRMPNNAFLEEKAADLTKYSSKIKFLDRLYLFTKSIYKIIK